MSVTKEQIQEAINYLDSIDTVQKSQANMDLSSPVNGGGSENITELKSTMLGLIKKAKEIQEKIKTLETGSEEVEELKKAEDEEEVKEVETKDEEETEEVEKGKKKEPKLDKEEIIKGLRVEVLESLKSERDEEVTLLKSMINDLTTKMEEIESTPLRKSFTNNGPMSYKDRFEKAESEGKTVVSKSLQKGKISSHIYNLFVESTDEIEKGELGEAITQFESAGYLDPKVANKLSQKYNLEII